MLHIKKNSYFCAVIFRYIPMSCHIIPELNSLALILISKRLGVVYNKLKV